MGVLLRMIIIFPEIDAETGVRLEKTVGQFPGRSDKIPAIRGFLLPTAGIVGDQYDPDFIFAAHIVKRAVVDDRSLNEKGSSAPFVDEALLGFLESGQGS